MAQSSPENLVSQLRAIQDMIGHLVAEARDTAGELLSIQSQAKAHRQRLQAFHGRCLRQLQETVALSDPRERGLALRHLGRRLGYSERTICRKLCQVRAGEDPSPRNGGRAGAST